MKQRAFAILAGLIACSDASGPASPVEYNLRVWRGASRLTGATAASVHRGDTLMIIVEVIDSTSTSGSLVTVRPGCDRNLSIRRAGTIVTTIPNVILCRDSVIQETVQGPFALLWEYRRFTWVVPGTYVPGDYTIQAEVLVRPSLQASQPIIVN